jgi:hypothetical protein
LSGHLDERKGDVLFIKGFQFIGVGCYYTGNCGAGWYSIFPVRMIAHNIRHRHLQIPSKINIQAGFTDKRTSVFALPVSDYIGYQRIHARADPFR